MPNASLNLVRKAKQYDHSGMLSAIENAPDLLRDPIVSRGGGRLLSSDGLEEIVLGGMGGSAMTGDVLSNWLTDRFQVPVSVISNKSLPGYVDKKTLFLALSYSGNTMETLSMYQHARKRNCRIVGVSTGGRLIQACAQHGTPFVIVRASVAPRAALYQMISACANLLQESGVIHGLRSQIEDASSEIALIIKQNSPRSNASTNKALGLARSLKDKVPIIYALERMSSVALRFKNQLNENSKMHAFYDLLPEAGHNEVEAWHRNIKSLRPVFIRDSRESSWERKMIEGFKRTILGARGIGLEVRTEPQSLLGRILAPILLLDYTSVYLALLNRTDPTPVTLIRQFRRYTGKP